MDIKHKTCDIQTKKTVISQRILPGCWYTYTIAIPMYQNPQHKNLRLLSQPHPHLIFIICDFWRSMREFLNPVVNRFIQQTLPTTNRKHFFVNILFYWVLPTEKCITEFFSSVVYPSSIVIILTTKTRLWICTCDCYLDCHEAGLYCYLVIHMENLLHLLQMFYFHLWPIYWLSLVFKLPHT
jgi:hypothetical protein